MDKALFYMGLAKKGRLIELGEEPVGGLTRAGKARLVIVAGDASDHTWRRAKSFVAGTPQICIRLTQNKAELGQAVGRESLAIAAFTDAPLALAFLKALQKPYPAEQEALEALCSRLQQRKQEAQAHRLNVKRRKSK